MSLPVIVAMPPILAAWQEGEAEDFPGGRLTPHPAYGMVRHMKATLIFEDRVNYPDGAILEMRIWKLPLADAERPHGLKYRLFYGYPGERVIGYDNERGKGSHRHYRNQEEPYSFTTAKKLIDDFLFDVSHERKRRET